MRKNKKLLLASVAAMGALALGVGATSTFAWYQVSAASINTSATDSKATISTYKDDFGIGDFTVTPVLGSVDTAVDYTASNGHTYYYLSDGTTKVDAGMADVPYGESTVHITISIPKGDMTAAQCLAAWNTARGSDTHVRVTLTPTSPVKISKVDGAGAYAATAGTAVTIDFAVNVLEAASWETVSTNYVYTASTQAWWYAVAGADNVETGVSDGTVGAAVAMYHS